MATPGQITAAIAASFALKQQTVIQIDRVLAAEGLRRTGGRGPSAVHLNAREVANLLTAVAAAPLSGAVVKEAARTCRHYMDLPVHNQNPYAWFGGKCPIPQLAALPETHTAGDCLTALIEASVSGDLQAAITQDFGGVFQSIPPRRVAVQFWGPLPQCRIEVGLPRNNHQQTSERKVYADNSPDDIDAIEAWSNGLGKRYGESGDLTQIREFTVSSIIAIGDLLRDEQ